MECDGKPNSSFDTLASQSNKKDNPRMKHTRPKCKQKHSGTTNTEKKFTTQQTNINCSEKYISQQVCVEKQKLQYIINVKTTVCDHKSKHRKNYGSRESDSQEKLQLKPSEYNRDIRKRSSIVPKCFRPHCVNSTINRNWGHRQVFWRYNTERHEERNRRYSGIHDINTRSKHNRHGKKSKQKHWRCRHSEYKYKQKNPRILLSPISSTPLEDDIDDNLSYEDISITSLKTNIEKVTCKHLKLKHRKYTKPYLKEDVKESKLDTLIRRTKERERRLVQQSRKQQLSRSINKPLYTSTPIHSECSGEFPISCDMAISFDSRSTLVLETHSPSNPIEELNNKGSEIEKLISYGYSPGSPIKNEDYVAKVTVNNNYKLVNIKNEPTMDIGVYSPIHGPEGSPLKCDFSKICVKNEVEVKAERSNINFKEDGGMHICKIETIKSEIDNDG